MVGKPEVRRSIGRFRWENNIKMDFPEVGWKCVD
jgi:hypothetical protein